MKKSYDIFTENTILLFLQDEFFFKTNNVRIIKHGTYIKNHSFISHIMYRLPHKFSTHLLAIFAFYSDCGNILPSEQMDHLDDCLCLKIIRWHHPTEVLEPAFVREFRAGGGITHLRYLQSYYHATRTKLKNVSLFLHRSEK